MTSAPLLNQYREKIRSAAELRALVGPRPRGASVALCHGVFDVAHPGHVRHLLHAKSEADILVASLTADIHVDKGPDRPHVPEALRAVSLAALEMVDYVIVDPNPTPLETLRTLEPDVFAKGFEYNAEKLNPKSAEEMTVVESYGGRMLFSPGDIVYSSTALIALAPPPIAIEKFIAAMTRAGRSFDDLRRLAHGASGLRAAVVGDLILERRVTCAALEQHTANGARRVRQQNAETVVTGAIDAARALAAAGTETTLIAPIGDDDGHDAARRAARDAGAAFEAEFNGGATPRRTAIAVDGAPAMLVDAGAPKSVGDIVAEGLAARIDGSGCALALFSDHGAGALHRKVRETLVSAAPMDATTAVETDGGRFDVDLAFLTERAARAAAFDGPDAPIRAAASEALRRVGARALLVDRADGGAAAIGPAAAMTVLDPVGGGGRDPCGNAAAARAYGLIAQIRDGDPAVCALMAVAAAAAGPSATPHSVVAVIDQLAREAGDD